MAQDFYAVFGLDEDDKHINTIDPDGVALASIQGLYQLYQEQDEHIQKQANRIQELEAENATLEQRVDNLEKRLETLEKLMSSRVQE
jgi:uncharacterized protein (DUF3084 family)